MPQLILYPLPYTASLPPQELVQPIQTLAASGCSDTEVFNTEVENRDTFLGVPRCVICGLIDVDGLDKCHIVGHSDIAMVRHMCSQAPMQDHLSPFQWSLLRQLGWAPTGVKESPECESRNGLIMCVNHHRQFDHGRFFIRYEPTVSFSLFAFVLLTNRN